MTTEPIFEPKKKQVSNEVSVLSLRGGTVLIMWANGVWLRSWDGFSRGYTLVAPAGRVPTDPWNMRAIAKLCFTVFHGIAPSKWLVMSKVVK